ncbi:phage tail protein [Bartonella sp. B17]
MLSHQVYRINVMVMMGLGDFRFSLNTAAYQSLTQTDSYPWVEQQRLGRKPAYQIISKDSKEITLDGIVFPNWRGGQKQIHAMRKEAEKLTPLWLVSGLGDVLGRYVILSISETQDLFGAYGQPIKQEFSLELREYGDDVEEEWLHNI